MRVTKKMFKWNTIHTNICEVEERMGQVCGWRHLEGKERGLSCFCLDGPYVPIDWGHFQFMPFVPA